MRSVTRRLLGLATAASIALTGCLEEPKPTRCDANTPCFDPERPFCDLNGTYGEPGTCIPSPLADANEPDADVPDADAPDAAPARAPSSQLPVAAGDPVEPGLTPVPPAVP